MKVPPVKALCGASGVIGCYRVIAQVDAEPAVGEDAVSADGVVERGCVNGVQPHDHTRANVEGDRVAGPDSSAADGCMDSA
jgi:hypothetical protein